jgi:hypothetical protein
MAVPQDWRVVHVAKRNGMKLWKRIGRRALESGEVRWLFTMLYEDIKNDTCTTVVMAWVKVCLISRVCSELII